MKIITLIENLVFNENLFGEHGLSIYIDTGDKKILFDTGQTGIAVKNAEILGVNLSEIDEVVISHGHYDHVNGISAFSKENSKAIINIKKDAFIEKYRPNKKDFIGLKYTEYFFNERVRYIEKMTEIAEGVFIIPETKIFFKNDIHYENLLIKKDGEFSPDNFTDEQFLTIVKDGTISIISGCSHKGITNAVETAKEIFKLPVKSVIGGFHINKCSEKDLDFIADYFREISPESIGCCHCTGIEKYSALRNKLGDKVFYNQTGNIFEI